MNNQNSAVLQAADYRIEIDTETGGIRSFVHPHDPHGMNWVEGKQLWGSFTFGDPANRNSAPAHVETLVTGSIASVSTYTSPGMSIKVERGFQSQGIFQEKITFVNQTSLPQSFGPGDLGIFATFNDNYQDAGTCHTGRCHTHIWCGESTSYVCALRMGGEAPHLGLVLTSGRLFGYSVWREENSNDRGDFILLPSLFSLKPNEAYELSWVMFWHDGADDFYRKASSVPGFIKTLADEYAIFPGETFSVSAESKRDWNALKLTVNNQQLDYVIGNDSVAAAFRPDQPGEYTFTFRIGNDRTFIKGICLPTLEEIAGARCRYIAGRQQYIDESSPLQGAYLIYDKETNSTYYGQRHDYNAGRERVGMGALIALYLSRMKGARTDHSELEQSLDLYYNFIRRELYDEHSGAVYNNVGRNAEWHRLYNYPWIAVLQMELFKLKGEKKYLEHMVQTILAYYRNDGHKFYCIGMPMLESVQLLNEQGMTVESNNLLALYQKHADMIVDNGIHYPPHEVYYEQSIVAPAASYTAEMYLLTGEERYLHSAKQHIRILSLFNGEQPDYRLNRVAIRHWDGYWFGKRRLYGDTFPHYWSTLTAVAYKYYYQATGETEYDRQANTILRNNLCLFDRDGFGSSAYVYPFSINGVRGQYMDPWANDQDWALLYALKFLPSTF